MGKGWWTRTLRLSPASSSCSNLPSSYIMKVVILHLIWIMGSGGGGKFSTMATECLKRNVYQLSIGYLGAGFTFNRTVKCEMYFQWTVADYCCYDRFDRADRNPFCCYSETYKLVFAVGCICLVLLASSFSIFFCWVYNLPHHLLYLFTCGKFHLNNWLIHNKNGSYVDPSFYSGEPFWARGAEMQPYPLRPMPPKIFYPAPPPKLKYRWQWDMANGEIPLFVIASRQFTRLPYSARPTDRNSVTSQQHHHLQNSTTHPQSSTQSTAISLSRRSSLSSHEQNISTSHPQRHESASRRGSSALVPYRGGNGSNSSMPPPAPFRVNIDEDEAAAELIEALKMLEERGDKTVAEWNAMGTPDVPQGHAIVRDIYAISGNSVNMALTNGSYGGIADRNNVRPNTTSGVPSLDNYRNYISLTSNVPNTMRYGNGGTSNGNSSSSNSNRPVKPNTEALNQQISTLGMPVYSMPGVHTAGVVNTVQNYHVVSSNLGKTMETILEDDSLDEDSIDDIENQVAYNPRTGSIPYVSTPEPPIYNNPSSSRATQINPTRRPPLKRRATINTGTNARAIDNPLISSRVSSAMDHVVLPNPTTQTVVPFSPTLPGSLGSAIPMDTAYVDAIVKQNEPQGTRRNSII